MEKAWRNHSFLMRSHLFPILILVTLFIITTASVALSQTDQYQTIKGVKFKDGSIVMGSIIQMNVETVTIRLDNGQTVVRKFGDVDTFIKQGDAVGSTTQDSKQYDALAVPTRSDATRYSSLEFGFMYYYYDYKEINEPPPFKSTESGWLPGIYLSYDHKKSSDVYVKLYGHFAGGDIEYDGAAGARPISFDHSQFFFKFEGNIGYTIPMGDKFLLIPYTGYGYRYWRRGDTEFISGAWFIKEEYTWSYVPVGIKIDYAVNDKWNIGASAAIHFMFGGQMKYFTSEVNSVYPNYEFDLGNEPGYYFEVPIRYRLDTNWSFIFTPWYQYSEIGKSNYIGTAHEPDSETHQYGVNFGVSYLF
jgi:hypothetical protein